MSPSWQAAPLPILPEGKRHSLFTIAFKFFPTTFLVKAIGITLTSSLFIYNYLLNNHVDSIVTRALLTAAIVVAAPTIALYLITLARAPRIRKREEREALHLQHIAHGDLEALQAKEQKEANEIVRLEQVASRVLKASTVKDQKENDRWDLLNESLRLQKETVELATEERLLVAQQVKEIKEEGEVIRKGLVSDDLEARHKKDLKEDKRWDVLTESLRIQRETVELASEERLLVAQQVKDVKDEREIVRIGLALDDLKARDVKDRKEDERWELLNESLRLQKKTVDLASEERLLVAKQVKDIKDEGEVMRKGLVSDDLEARHIKEEKEEKRWNALYERLRIQDERNEEREQRQLRRDEEQTRIRHEEELKDKYRTLFDRYLRNSSGDTLNRDVADGLAPIPDDWLNKQPEILKNPALLRLLDPYNGQ
ncbi:MAG: hypothetical protein Q8922_08005 [Bacteroidota bacterium]|nr:hypothetical protein [Bacteroidota bacterium]MDP4234167.1 hypothetical protein [Bacteroidota bacterium]MDP4244011.1 hypothetical protein [Bacteroidota bacterium]MDP4287867.1 hypothetical protein [Bacteroidota bacterium]